MSRPSWDQRIERAAELELRSSATAEILRFSIRLVRLQRDLCGQFQGAAPELDAGQVERAFPDFLDALSRFAPPELAEQAARLRGQGEAAWMQHLEAEESILAHAFLGPWAESAFPNPQVQVCEITSVCPCCNRKPQASVLHEAAHGARRNLVCSLCQWDWEFRRILCPACAEDRFDKLPVFRAGEFPHLRVEACDTCQNYLLAIDMTQDGRAVACVDNLAALSLHLWARGQGYHPLAGNLLML